MLLQQSKPVFIYWEAFTSFKLLYKFLGMCFVAVCDTYEKYSPLKRLACCMKQVAFGQCIVILKAHQNNEILVI